MSITAIKQMVEALEEQRIFTLRPDHEGEELTPKKVIEAIEAGRQAIEQAEKQEPCQYAIDVAMPEHRCVGKCQYAAQRQWVGLTDEDLYDCFSNDPHVAMKNVEAVLKEKNT